VVRKGYPNGKRKRWRGGSTLHLLVIIPTLEGKDQSVGNDFFLSGEKRESEKEIGFRGEFNKKRGKKG